MTLAVEAWDGHVHLESGLRLRAQAGGGRSSSSAAASLRSALAALVAEQVNGGARRADLRLNPQSWLKRGVAGPAFRAALSEARADARGSGLELRFLVTVKREMPEREIEQAVDFAESAAEVGVIGLDISRSYAVEEAGARPPSSPDPRRLRSSCSRARSAGLVVAVHCGGYDVEDDVWVAIDDLGAVRIGHGLAIGRSNALVERLASDRITIEVCPSAAVRQGATLARHPCSNWHDAGVPLVLGTDHPLALGTSLRQEARKLRAMLRQISRGSTRIPA